jgi:hypothetical protein
VTPEDRSRFARHLSLPEIGAAGQAKLSSARVRVAPGTDPRVARWAIDHATRVGARQDEAGRAITDAAATAVRELAGRPELEDAAAFLLGALAALELVRTTTLAGEVAPMSVSPLAPPE